MPLLAKNLFSCPSFEKLILRIMVPPWEVDVAIYIKIFSNVDFSLKNVFIYPSGS
jgi:hypothetical protein